MKKPQDFGNTLDSRVNLLSRGGLHIDICKRFLLCKRNAKRLQLAHSCSFPFCCHFGVEFEQLFEAFGIVAEAAADVDAL